MEVTHEQFYIRYCIAWRFYGPLTLASVAGLYDGGGG
jgi:hypothetical protein